MKPPLLSARGLSVAYQTATGPVPACVDVDLTVRRGEILGIAGESGCGKSTLVHALIRLARPPATITDGQLLWYADGSAPVDLVPLPEKTLRSKRWTQLAIVLQSAMDALNPVTRLGTQFIDVLRVHDRSLSKAAAAARAAELLGMVGIPADRVRSFPHEMSGGMRQRATIALALACGADLVVMDEPTTAVDVVMQRQILSQVLRLQDELDFAVVFVTHDLALLLDFADRVAVMYAGRIVETGTADQIRSQPKHPYTRALRDSFPPLHGPRVRREGIAGAPADLRRLPDGCAFHPRCPHAMPACVTDRPELSGMDGQVACHLEERA
ncbi:ABC transporter ATP-binding protein [Hamadaea sp. NPDC051192]|uniref:ABC transporter ATP-binding protein n=1 Tax=Hamadaea sp. NPDC051192 TaxID=3154940 RepID=UPI003428C95B